MKVFAKSIVLILALGFMCISSCSRDGGPLIIQPDQQTLSQLRLLTGITARYYEEVGEVWVGAPPGTSLPLSEARFLVPGELTRRVQTFSDGSFLFRYRGNPTMSSNYEGQRIGESCARDANKSFVGNPASSLKVEWTDQSRSIKRKTVYVTDIAMGLKVNEAPAGKYPNRILKNDNTIWVVNSGDDELASYDLVSLSKKGQKVKLPSWSNPWEAAFADSRTGVITTLFDGVYKFNLSDGTIKKVEIGTFREFASPNGCVIFNDNAWVTNTNPVSYFPTKHLPGWISEISLSGEPTVKSEINSRKLNPQFLLTDGQYIYLSCSGTIDFAPPNYVPEAKDAGCVQVINPHVRQTLDTYDLGRGGPGPMALSPDRRFLYCGSSIAGWLFRIDLEKKKVLNDASNPIVVSDSPVTFISFIKSTPEGLLICGSFNDDRIHFVDSWTGQVDPKPFFPAVDLDPNSSETFYGIQDAVLCERNGQRGVLILTTVESGFSWLPI